MSEAISPQMDLTGGRRQALDSGPASHKGDQTRTPLDQYYAVRQATTALCQTLEPEDCVVQSMPDASPTKWHLAHTTWFFETFVLRPHQPDYRVFHDRYSHLFNSYYNAIGDRVARPERGLLSRPTVAEVFAYRDFVDDKMAAFLRTIEGDIDHPARGVLEIGLHHEQQHQELLLTDIKHVLSRNPLAPVFAPLPSGLPSIHRETASSVPPLGWIPVEPGLVTIGHSGSGFAYDNEGPLHTAYLTGGMLADRLVTNAEYQSFIDAGGYGEPKWWLSEGWDTVQQQGWQAPLYWYRQGEEWHTFTLHGLEPIRGDEPVTHVSYFEADAFARWSGARLPTEFEWEHVVGTKLASDLSSDPSSDRSQGNFVESRRYHPAPWSDGNLQFFGDVWEWTQSPYLGYPGYAPPEGAIGEYNGKFMCNQFVLRGGSCATPKSHIRATYRNFFPSAARWQFMGIRLAK